MLPQLYFALFLLCLSFNNLRTEEVKSELVPESLKIWNLFGSEVNFANNATKVASPDCTNMCGSLTICPCPTEATTETQPLTTTPPTTTTTLTTVPTTTETTEPPFKMMVTCNKAAHYDEEEEHCVCNNPEMDGRIRNPEVYGSYSEGEVCYVCYEESQTRAVVFIIDDTGSVEEEGWEAQKRFMQQLLDSIGDIKVGVVVIAAESYVAVPINDYKENKEAIAKFVETKEYTREWTSVGVALYLARTMLEEVEADAKEIIIFSDGDYDGCTTCPQYKKDNIKAHPQKEEAEKIHDLGIHVTYVAINYENSPQRIQMIAGDPKNIIKIENFTAFDTNVLNSVVNTICTVEEA